MARTWFNFELGHVHVQVQDSGLPMVNDAAALSASSLIDA